MAWLMKAGKILAPWLEQSGFRHHLAERRLQTQWVSIAGHLMAAHSQPLRLRHHRLTIAVESPAWLHQLSFLQPLLLEQITRAIGTGLVTELQLVVGPIESPLPNDPGSPVFGAPSRPSPPLTQEAAALITTAVTPLQDPAMAQLVRRLMEKALASTPSRSKSAHGA
jgi:hypothetical protein